MTQVDWRRRYREATEQPPPGARQRVWRALTTAQPASPVRLAPAFVGAAMVGVLLVLALVPRPVSGPRLGDGYALVASAARYSLDGRRVRLERGRLAVSVWGAPLELEVQGRRVELEAAIAVVEVSGSEARVLPVEGVALVDGRPAAATAPGLAAAGDVGPLLAVEAPDARLIRAEARARAASEAGAWGDAAAAYDTVASSSSLRAEVALLRRGEVELRHLAAPERARRTFDEAARRFPQGALALESSLSALEAAAALADWADVDRRAQAFEVSFPTSGRLEEVRRARALALYALRQVDQACAVAQQLALPVPFAAECAPR